MSEDWKEEMPDLSNFQFIKTNRHTCGKFMKWIPEFNNYTCRSCNKKYLFKGEK